MYASHVAKPRNIELPDSEDIPILYEDRSVLAIDKPAGWMLVPYSWQKTNRNLQAAITSSIAAGDFWARSRNLRFLRFIHRLDGDTTGVLLLGKSPGAVRTIGELFESRRMQKRYLAVTLGIPERDQWECKLPIGPDPSQIGRMRVDSRDGKAAQTAFRVVMKDPARKQALLEALPYTGRTHQIRVHLAVSKTPVLNDPFYGIKGDGLLALRAAELSYTDPFTRRAVHIRASESGFMAQFGFASAQAGQNEKGSG